MGSSLQTAGVFTGLLGLLLTSCAIVQKPQTSRPDTGLTLPAGFHAAVYASGLNKPRLMAVAPNGDLFVAESGAGQVDVLPNRNGDGVPEGREVFASGLSAPHSLAFHGGFLYVAGTDSVVRFPYAPGDTRASGAPEKILDLPAEGLHKTRTLVFGPDDRMYVAVGSTCNACLESDPRRAAVWVYDADGKNGKPYATGLRNAVGLEWSGGTLYATVNGRDLLGNDVPPEAFFRLRDGGNYGWPFCYSAGGEQVRDQSFAPEQAVDCRAAQPAFATTTAHSAPLGLAFYTGTAFPPAYRGQMFVALHGSWNRLPKSGYKVITVDPGTGEVKDFLTGFLEGGGLTTSGRPVDLQVAADGALFLTDDGNGLIYRITYTGS
ncbi:PQQ-dependent sugar dehydrogenase [Deinococcus hopiensis]|uniref:Glucose/arabinose dehydrogenase, beta-propeller fold n=1 Tax=Deinococcus hopiensis KR-140 TaxID=695939 RepID=A0A1W1VWE3_9DEIO|nr:sorbosone dehydrogenase family protein [Deinococcus hopiensis]SMB97648.1 Glucose/arabinose dehydrogenase, beta-propeller fold [Deinococcus hopiensis KR-140]